MTTEQPATPSNNTSSNTTKTPSILILLPSGEKISSRHTETNKTNSITRDDAADATLNFNQLLLHKRTPSSESHNSPRQLDGLPPLKSSSSYIVKFLLTLTNHNHRTLLQYPHLPQYRIRCHIHRNTENLFVYDVKPSQDHVNRYYVTVGLSAEVPPPVLSATSDPSPQPPFNSLHVDSLISFQLNDDTENAIHLRVVGTFVDSASYERLFSRKAAIRRGLTLHGSKVRLLRASPLIDQGCTMLWDRDLPFVVANEDEDEEDELWSCNLLFPTTARIDYNSTTLRSKNQSANGASLRGSDSRLRAHNILQQEESDQDEDDFSESQEVTQESLNNSLRRRREANQDNFVDEEENWDSTSEDRPIQEEEPQQSASGAVFDEGYLLYLDACCAAHNRWMKRFSKPHSCGPLKDSRQFLIQNAKS